MPSGGGGATGGGGGGGGGGSASKAPINLSAPPADAAEREALRLFDIVDVGGDGTVNAAEVFLALTRVPALKAALGIRGEGKQAVEKALGEFAAADTDGSGLIDRAEFVAWVGRRREREAGARSA